MPIEFYDLKPISCTCGSRVSKYFEAIEDLENSGVPTEEAFNILGIERYCCRLAYRSGTPLIISPTSDENFIHGRLINNNQKTKAIEDIPEIRSKIRQKESEKTSPVGKIAINPGPSLAPVSIRTLLGPSKIKEENKSEINIQPTPLNLPEAGTRLTIGEEIEKISSSDSSQLSSQLPSTSKLSQLQENQPSNKPNLIRFPTREKYQEVSVGDGFTTFKLSVRKFKAI